VTSLILTAGAVITDLSRGYKPSFRHSNSLHSKIEKNTSNYPEVSWRYANSCRNINYRWDSPGKTYTLIEEQDLSTLADSL
jgi:hypothetical protein